MLVRTLWDPWETASYRNNMLPFSIIIKLHLYKAEAPAALRMSQKVGATSVSLQMAQPQNQLCASPTGVFRNWPPWCCWFQCPRLWIGWKESQGCNKKVLQNWNLWLRLFCLILKHCACTAALWTNYRIIIWLRCKQIYLQFTIK